MGIKWTKSDYITLGKAISQFNKKVKELEQETDGLNLPELQDYQTKKNRIQTRYELERYIKSLKRFQRETQQKAITLDSGDKLTKWEYSEIKKGRQRLKNNMYKEIEELNTPDESGYSRAQMGSGRFRQLEQQLKKLDNFENLRSYKLDEMRELILRKGTADYELWRKTIYKENFLTMFEEFSNYRGYKEFKEKIEKLNPEKFYDFIKKEPDLLEIKYWYDTKSGRVVPSGLSSEEHFIGLLERYNIKIGE